MEKFLAILALLSIGLGLGIVFNVLWEIVRKIFFPASRLGVDAIATTALLSALISRLFCQINGPLKYNLIVAVGTVISSTIFLRIINYYLAKKTGP